MRKKTTRVFLGYVPYPLVEGFVKRGRFIGKRIAEGRNLSAALKKTDISLPADEYVTYGLINYLVNGLLLGFLIFGVSYLFGERGLRISILLAIATFLAITLLFTVLLLRMPGIQAKTKAAKTERSLLFALQDLLLQINSGVTLYQALVSVAESNYGEVSELFDYAARRINTGSSMHLVIKELLDMTESEYMRRALWQMSASMRAGADLRRTLSTVISELNAFQKAQIMSYARELNLWSLGYMLFAVAIPTIGSTMLVILSTFAGFGVDSATFIAFIILSFIIQFAMVMLVKSRRPVVQF